MRLAMLERILLAIDDSDESARALRLARSLASASSAEVVVLHVREKEVCCCGEPWETPMTCTPDELVAHAVGALESAGVEARALILNSAGRAAQAILDAADDLDAGLLVAGCRRRQTLGGLLEKTLGQKLADNARLPLLLVP
jgi:nucleotide-binding universal stress UspA family protein